MTPVPSRLMRKSLADARIVTDPAGNSKLAKRGEGGRRGAAKDDAVAAAILAVASGDRARRHGEAEGGGGGVVHVAL